MHGLSSPHTGVGVGGGGGGVVSVTVCNLYLKDYEGKMCKPHAVTTSVHLSFFFFSFFPELTPLS